MFDVKEHGAAGVGEIGDMHPAAGEFPDEPGVHGAEEKLPQFRLLPGMGDVVQDPFDFRGGEVGVHQKPRPFPDKAGEYLILFQFLAEFRCPAALPDNGVAYGPSGVLVPDDGGLPLVGDAHSRDLLRGYAAFGQHLAENAVLAGVDLHGVVLHPAGLGIELGKLLLGHFHNVLPLVKEDAAAAGCTLIQGDDVFFHG